MLPLPSPTVIYQTLPDGAVLFSMESEVYFGLNVVGARVWELLPAHRTLDRLAAAIAGEFPGVALETVVADVNELLQTLVEHRLVQPSDAVRSVESTA